MNNISTARKDLRVFLLLLSFFATLITTAQISHGGNPLPLEAITTTRSVMPSQIPFVDMEHIDNQSALWRSVQGNDNFKSLEFAHKFFVNLRPDNSGITFNTYDNMKVWRVGIRSVKAYSLNILFSKFNLPEGAKLFVYNSDQSEILGSYTHMNNSDINMLPIQPIAGDEIIVEYQEPSDSTFRGEIEIGEVNHDFIGILRATEPRDPEQNCHPNLVCYPEDIEAGSGVVAIIINGKTYCTASLINNTENNGTPYLITATHCLNDDYNTSFLSNRKYDMVAGNIVAFFGYESPNCEKEIRGNVQMSMASLDSVFISERHDVSLLKFKEIPPVEYQPYYLGWNATNNNNQAPYHGIHHPNGGIKKVAIENDALAIGSFGTQPPYNMEPNVHWEVKAWDVAATEGGSSGSPLLDNQKRIVGTLTGGQSYCSSPKGPDLYASLNKVWDFVDNNVTPISLKSILDPENSGALSIEGYNPYTSQPYTKGSNFLPTDIVTETYHKSVPMFATNNTYGYREFAEEFYSKSGTKLQGVFITSPIMNNAQNMNIRIKVYGDNDGTPGQLIHEQQLTYSFKYYQNGGFHEEDRAMNKNVENYLRFTTPISVTGKFYIAYAESSQKADGFKVMNVQPRKVGANHPTTAWVKDPTGWVKSSETIENPINTSLMIAPYVRGMGLDINPDIKPNQTKVRAFYNRETEKIFIEANRDIISWTLYDTSGRMIVKGESDSSISRVALPLSTNQAGIYLLKVVAEGKKETIKVLVR